MRMQDAKFVTLTCMLATIFEQIDQGHRTGHVAIACHNDYNLTFNIAAKSAFPEITGKARTKEFNEENFVNHIPPEFKHDLDLGQVKDLFKFLQTSRNFTGMELGSDIGTDHDTLFLFTDKEIILMMREEYDLSGVN